MAAKQGGGAALALALLAAVAANAAQAADVHSEEFVTYMQRYGKTYCAPEMENGGSPHTVCEESLKRESIYLDNKRFIEEYNQQHHTHQLGINGFADLSSEEFTEKYLGFVAGDNTIARDGSELQINLKDPLPPSVDWREDGMVTPVKNQEQCGACWAFAACAAIEGAFAKVTSRLVSLSEQELVDCDTKSNGCSGGNFEQAFAWVMENKGINSELHYPYIGKDDEGCLPKKEKQIEAYITNFVRVQTGNETQLQIAVSQQPVAVAVEGDQKAFQFYRSGVFDGECGTKLNHAVTIVGYGEDSMPYWILKNSWGEGWGEDGYMSAITMRN